MDSPNPNGLTTHELVLEIRQDLKDHISYDLFEHREMEEDISARPTRTEIMGLLGGAGVVSGVIFGLITLI